MGGDFFSWAVSYPLRKRFEYLIDYILVPRKARQEIIRTDQSIFQIESLELIGTWPNVTVGCKVCAQAL